MQPAQVIYTDDKQYVVVKNFPHSRKGRAEWWLEHQGWLKKQHSLDAESGGIRFIDIGSGFLVNNDSADRYFYPYSMRTYNNPFCFPQLKLIANCIRRVNFFFSVIVINKNGEKTTVYRDKQGEFSYSKQTGVTEIRKWDE